MKGKFVRWCPCPECDGTGRVWQLQKGSGVMGMVTCWKCWGFARVQREMTRAEVLALLGPENPQPSV